MQIPFIQSKNYTPTSGRKIDLIVIHDMEAPEAKDTAENVAKWFAGANAPEASCHYCIDADSIVQCVKDKDVAWHAPHANHNGLGLEHAGYARQTPGQWDDLYSKAMLARSAALTAALCGRYGIPVKYLNASRLKAGERGITTHAQVSLAFPVPSAHTDPGPNFPMVDYIALVQKFRTTPDQAPSSNPLPGPRPIPKWFWAWAQWRLHGRIWERPDGAPKVIPPWAWRALAQLAANRKKGNL